jgi:glucosylglycerate synthase
MDYDTAFRPYLTKRIEQIESADIVVGIPCYNATIVNVLKQVSRGLTKHYKSARSVILISDGGSTDDTREVAREEEIMPWQEKIVFVYRGLAGKGTALRAIFEAADKLGAGACVVVDADLRSITPDWVRHLIEPVLEKDFDYVAPMYSRYKWDGTITNNVAYNLTRSLYGKRIRQPIGGDFGLSKNAIRSYLTQNVWMTDVARFGIDIWMTTQAVASGCRVCQANLGVKVHDPKDPGVALGPMFRQVVWTLFTLMEQHAPVWKDIRGSEAIETFGSTELAEPEPINVNQELLVQNFKLGFQHFGALWKDLLSSSSYNIVQKLAASDRKNFFLDAGAWAHILYEIAATFHHWAKDRAKLVDLISPLYEARVAAFINETAEMTGAESEQVVERQAEIFEQEKPYLLKRWETDESGPKPKSLLQKVIGG